MNGTQPLDVNSFQPSDCRLAIPSIAMPFETVTHSLNVPPLDGAYRICVHNGLLYRCCDYSILVFDEEIELRDTIVLDENICLTGITSHADLICASSLYAVRIYRDHKLVCTLNNEEFGFPIVVSHRGLLYISGENPIFVFDVSQTVSQSYSEKAILRGHTSRVTALCSDKNHLYSCSKDNTVRIWDDQNVCIRTVDVGCSIRKLIKVKDRFYGCFGISFGQLTGVGVWDNDMKRIGSLLDDSEPTALGDALCANDDLIYTTAHNSTGSSIKVWNRDHQQVSEFRGFAEGESTLVMYKDKLVLSVCDGGMYIFT